MRLQCLCLLFSLVVPSIAAEPSSVKKDLDSLQGVWAVELFEYNGQDLKERYKITFDVKGDLLTVKGDGKVRKEYAKLTLKLDPTTMPKCLDLTVTGGSQKDAKLEGIYELKGDEWQLCVKVFGNDRPGKMGSAAEAKYFTATTGVGSGDVMFRNKEVVSSKANTPTTENLGEQSIDGIQATGTRVTTTIPSGQMGNEQPITVTSERWYSSQLKAVVMTKHNDPWAGELKTQFTDVNNSEPDPSLFTVPSDYRIVDDKMGRLSLQAPLPPLEP